MERTSGERLRLLLEDAGAADALVEALGNAGIDRVPEATADFVAFLEGPLLDALIGRLHPATAGELVGRIREEVADQMGSGRRIRPGRDGQEDLLVPTVPPPADDQAQRAYEDLATGAIHDRATPAWGMRRVTDDSVPGEALWILVTTDGALVEEAQRAAPGGTEVIVASSMAVLKGALSRADHPAGAVVVDAERPSMPLDRSLAALMETGPTRVLLWRMSRAERERLSEAMPHVRSWLPCDAEVTPAEIVQLLGL